MSVIYPLTQIGKYKPLGFQESMYIGRNIKRKEKSYQLTIVSRQEMATSEAPTTTIRTLITIYENFKLMRKLSIIAMHLLHFILKNCLDSYCS